VQLGALVRDEIGHPVQEALSTKMKLVQLLQMYGFEQEHDVSRPNSQVIVVKPVRVLVSARVGWF
jgi:hypothetical protein